MSTNGDGRWRGNFTLQDIQNVIADKFYWSRLAPLGRGKGVRIVDLCSPSGHGYRITITRRPEVDRKPLAGYKN